MNLKLEIRELCVDYRYYYMTHLQTYRWFKSDIGYMIAQQFKLLIALVVLFPQMLILLFQFSQFVSDPFFYPRCFRFHLPGVLQP